MYLKIKTEKEVRSTYFNGDYSIKFIENGEIEWNEDGIKTFINKEFNGLGYGKVTIKFYNKEKFDNEERRKRLGLCLSIMTDTDLTCYFIPHGDKYEAYLENDLGKTIETLIRRSGKLIIKFGETIKEDFVGDGKISCKTIN